VGQNADMYRLAHLNISVADLDRASAFYGRWFGFDRVLAQYDDGTRFITDASGFELGLHAGAPTVSGRDWHFGFIASDARAVIDLRSAMTASGLTVEEPENTRYYVGFKCRDPDGHIVEVYFEPR